MDATLTDQQATLLREAADNNGVIYIGDGAGSGSGKRRRRWSATACSLAATPAAGAITTSPSTVTGG
ncbi:hypothetical protein Ade02nite_20620 [Paractinoplanes deccanensis]|uniref:Uncharacterized protein n=1 Tax=Paractinoplanes deccanensis TaxID=113561 RepID=A0ABQ3Y0A8_9ACTN|nr:hypothetical protein Ade02nite_20620 [Actinoplanes deccanensis]